MFECLSLLARQVPRIYPVADRDFRKLRTVRGAYFVEWEPAAVRALVNGEQLSADEFLFADARELQQFVRDLFLLALRDEFDACRRSPLANLGRELMDRKQRVEEQRGHAAASAA